MGLVIAFFRCLRRIRPYERVCSHRNGGKQYQVKSGDVINIELLPGEMKAGDKVTFDKVVLVDDGSNTTIGTPYITGAKVEAIYKATGRLPKVTVIKTSKRADTSRKTVIDNHSLRLKLQN